MSFSQRLLKARQKRGLTQRQIADALLVSVQAVSLWENEKGAPKGERLTKLAQLLDVSVIWLIGESEDPSPAETIKKHGEAGIAVISFDEIMQYLANNALDRTYPNIKIVLPTYPSLGRQLGVEMCGAHYPKNLFAEDEIAIFDTGLIGTDDDIALVTMSYLTRPSDNEQDPPPIRHGINLSVGIRRFHDIRDHLENDIGSKTREAGTAEQPKFGVIGILVERRTFRPVRSP